MICIRSRLGRALLVTILVTLFALIPATSARAADVKLTTNITHVEISGSKPEDTVSIEGTVTNDSPQSVYTVQAIFWWAAKPLESVSDFRASLTDTRGTRLVTFDENFARITTPGGEFSAGASARFKISATLEQLGITTPGHAYTLGVQTRASLDGRSIFHTLGEDRTGLVVPDPERPVPVTNLVVLSAPSSQVRPGVFLNNLLADNLRGRLTRLVELAATTKSAILLDPLLLAEVQAMAAGYQVQTANGLAPGADADLAKSFLAALDRRPADEKFPTLYGVPDAGRLGIETATEAVDQSPQNTLAYLGWGRATEAALATIKRSHVTAAIVTNAESEAAVQRGPVPILRASDAFVATTTKQRDHLDVDAWLSGNQGQLRVAKTVAEAEMLALKPWMTHRPMATLLAQKPSANVRLRDIPYPTLPETFWKQAAAIRPDLAAYRELAMTPQGPTPAQNQAKLASSSWFDSEPAANAFLDGLRREVEGITAGERVELVTAKQFVLSGKSGDLPMSVANHLNDSIQVRLQFKSEHPQRLQMPNTELFTVRAGETGTINVHPEAVANGSYPVTVQIVTDNGTPVGEPTAIVVEATNLSVIGWVITVAAAGVFVAATGWRIRQVAAKRAATHPVQSTDGDRSDATHQSADQKDIEND